MKNINIKFIFANPSYSKEKSAVRRFYVGYELMIAACFCQLSA